MRDPCYGAVEYSESQSFCGEACHTVMQPEFVAHQNGPHAKVHCVTTSTGCFRCHDDLHKTRDGRAISQDCELCYSIE